MTIGERIKEIRKSAGLTQQKFADKIGTKQNTVAQYEIGRNAPIDPVIAAICREFDVNETWLRTGDGDMFRPKSRGEEIGEIVKAAATHDPEEAAKFFVSLLEDMSDGEIMLMYEIFKRHFPTDEKKGRP